VSPHDPPVPDELLEVVLLELVAPPAPVELLDDELPVLDELAVLDVLEALPPVLLVLALLDDALVEPPVPGISRRVGKQARKPTLGRATASARPAAVRFRPMARIRTPPSRRGRGSRG
jgi:hypothetical protein